VTVKQPVAPHKTMLSSMNRAGCRGVARGDGGDPFAEGHAPAGYGKWGGFADNISCAAAGKHPACQPTAEPKFSFRGASRTGEHGVRPGASRLCAPVYADSTAIWWSVGVRAARAIGAQSKPARRLMAVVSAHCR